MHSLSDWGFRPFFAAQITDSDALVGRVTAEHRGAYEIWSPGGTGLARLAGRLANGLADEAFPGVGDWVSLSTAPGPGQTGLIDGVLERQTLFVRGAAGPEARGQVIAANVDVVFIVTGLDGDYNIHRIERYLARIWSSGAQPVVVLNKADLCADIEERSLAVETACMGVPVLVVSALQEHSLARLEAHLKPGITAAFVGSSGAGKSTLINQLLGEERLATQAVRAGDSRGRHTTTHRQLFLLPGGGLVIDTPGMRELALLDDGGIDTVFADIEELAQECLFRDCTHQSEPGCAVQAAVAAGGLDQDRLDHYLKMTAEARAYEVRRDTRRRREEERAFSKRISRDGKLIRRWKEGE